MKRRVLSYGTSGTHSSISSLSDFAMALSISDYDAFILDPVALASRAFTPDILYRRRKELRDLVQVKGGIVICILRAEPLVNFGQAGLTPAYTLFEPAGPPQVTFLRAKLQLGRGSQIRLVQIAKGAVSGYLRVLQQHLHFEAYLETDEASIVQSGGTVFAVNSLGSPVALEFSVGGGRLCFVPVAEDITGERLGAAFAQVVDAHFGGPATLETPSWVSEISVPGADAHNSRIGELNHEKERIMDEISALTAKQLELLNYRILLFGYGKSILEPVVRKAFRLFGFDVPEPDTYEGEWDVELHESRSTKTALGEVEGSEGFIDVDKFRQLLGYCQEEILEGRVHKGVLIGNGFRLKPLDSPERQNQFSTHALNGASANGYCLVPTAELFKAVCSVLENPEDEGLKIEIRNSLLATVGIWTFSR